VALGTWDDLGDWDVSGVKDFSYAFSKHRDQAGGSMVKNGNPKAGSFIETDFSKWNTTSVTTLQSTFYGANEMNSDLSAWKVGNVVTLDGTFYGATRFAGLGLDSWDTASVTTLYYTFIEAGVMNSDLSAWKVRNVVNMLGTFWNAKKFAGVGLDSWDTASVTTLHYTFQGASEMNADLSAWKVGNVVNMYGTFTSATRFAGVGLGSWDTASVTTLQSTFYNAVNMNSDLGAWKVGNVVNMYGTFFKATRFAGVGLDTWDTASVTTLHLTFYNAGVMNSDLGAWKVGNVVNMDGTFQNAKKFAGLGLANWNVATVSSMTNTFTGAIALESCTKHRIALAWADNIVFQANYDTNRASEKCPPQTDAEFKLASWDWVQDATMATHKWGDLGDWDVSEVKDFSYAFSGDRNEAGGFWVNAGNPKAATFVGTGLSKWSTTSITSLIGAFNGATSMNSDLSGWKVGKVRSLQNSFYSASKFAGVGLDAWDTASVATLFSAFTNAGEMNSNLSGWKVGNVVNMEGTFQNTLKFAGVGLDSWDTASVTTLKRTFRGAPSMNSDLSAWKVGKVTTLEETFHNKYSGYSSKFAGVGLDSWDTASVKNLNRAFTDAGEMNSDLSGWNVGNVASMDETFNGASKFAGVGLANWNVATVTSMTNTFTGAIALESCTKLRIALAWADNIVFQATDYDTDWAGEKCPPQTDAEFKRASWDWVQDATMATHKWGDLSDWDVSDVKDFSHAFSSDRNEAGGSYVRLSNLKAATFIGSGMSNWNTTSINSLEGTFRGATSMNSDLSGWKVGKVRTLQNTFYTYTASRFAGVGLDSWDTSSVTTLFRAFTNAGEMNSDLSGWNVGNVVNMLETFNGASKFAGVGLGSWDTTSVTTLQSTFQRASEMNADLGVWQVDKVATMQSTFNGALKFAGTGLRSWITSSVNNLLSTFKSAVEMNVNLGGWSVTKGE
jgi:hypothetical protein